MNGTTSQLAGVPKEITNVRDRAKVAYPPTLPPPGLPAYLVDNKGSNEKQGLVSHDVYDNKRLS